MSGIHLKRLHADGDSFIFWLGPDSDVYSRSLGIHVDFPWSDCVRHYDAPKRAYIHGYFFSAILGAPAQAWSPRTGFRAMRWRRVVVEPARWLQCNAMFDAPTPVPGEWRCTRLRGHKGAHA